MRRHFLVFAMRALFALACGLIVAVPPVGAQDRVGGAAGAGKAPVVFAAASLKTALDAIAADWKKQTGHDTTISYGASSALARQIEQGAPADVFISADLDWMDWVGERHLINPSSRETLLGNALVLVAASDAKADFKIARGADLSAALGDSRLAVAEVNAVPAGKYAKAALENLGMWTPVANRLAPALDVRGALNFVARGEARFGIVYATDAKAEPKVKVVDTFPASSHPPILYPAALTAASRNPDAAALLGFLRSADAVREFTAQGFVIVAKPGAAGGGG
jgi:molybdate transport system substrate-binding protein